MMSDTETIDKLFLELSAVTTAKTHRELLLLSLVKKAYRKHVLFDEDIGWEELGWDMQKGLALYMGDKQYQEWAAKHSRVETT